MNPDLEEKILSLCAPYTPRDLLRGARELSLRYNAKKSHQTDLHRAAYLATRLPATYAAVSKVLSEISLPQTILDCGAGPGTSLWALLGSPITSITLLEKDPRFIALGKQLAPSVPFATHWKNQSFLSFEEGAKLILFSYSLGEIPDKERSAIINRAYQKAEEYIVVIEPGTPEGFARVREVRKILLGLGMSLRAPCPHQSSCPIIAPNWCHFSVRLPRSSLHRFLKGGKLGYEDEKFSYLIASKTPYQGEGMRVLRRPIVCRGYTTVSLCTPLGIQQRNLTGKERKGVDWGTLIH